MQQHQLRDDNSNTAEPALAEEKEAEQRAIEEKQNQQSNPRTCYSQTNYGSIKRSIKYTDRTCRNRKWHWKAQQGVKNCEN